MINLFSKAFDLKVEDRLPAFLTFALFCTVFIAYSILRPVRETMGIEGGVKNLQWLFSATFISSILIQLPFGYLATKIKRKFLFSTMYLFFISNLILFIILLVYEVNPILIGRIFYVWLSVFNLLAISLCWSLVNELMQLEQSKKFFAIGAAGCSLGAVIGPFLTSSLNQYIGTIGLLTISSIMLLGTIVVSRYLRSWAENNHPMQEKEQVLKGSFLQGFKDLFYSPYLLGISLFIIFTSCANTFLYFQLMEIVAETYPNKDDQTFVFSIMDLIVNSCTLFIQFFVTGRLAKYAGIKFLIGWVPLIIGLGFLLLLISPIFIVVAIVMISRRIGEYALIRPGREMLFNVRSPDEKYRAKNIIDSGIYRGADLVSAWISHFLQTLGGIPLVAIGGIILSIAWGALGFKLSQSVEQRSSKIIKPINKPN